MAKGRLAGALFCFCAAVALLLPATALAAEPDWTGWTKLTPSDTNLSAGKYYLEGDVTIESTIEINGEVTLDLNGYVLKKTGDEGSVVEVKNNSRFVLRDSRAEDEDAKHYFTVGDGGLWTLSDEVTENVVVGGIITGGRGFWFDDGYGGEFRGGGVLVGFDGDSAGVFVMEGGSIVGCSATWGGGVYVGMFCTFVMKGGSIVGCSASTESSGVYVNGVKYDDRGLFSMEGGSVYGDVSNEGRITNVASSGATVCYGKLSNNRSIESCLVEFKDGEDLYAWEVVKEGSKAVCPADPAKDGFAFAGWCKDEDCTEKYSFDEAVNGGLTLYASWEELITVTVPFDTEVTLGDNGVPGKTIFDLEVVQANAPEDHYADVVVSGSVETDGVGVYDGGLTITGPYEQLRAMLCEGAFVRQVDGGEEGWTYDDAVWALLFYEPVDPRSLDEQGEDAYSALIYPASCELTDNGPYYYLDEDDLHGEPADKMAFANVYTRHDHDYALEHDADGHWDECVCGDVQNEELHRFGEWKVTKEATETARGEKERVCAVCGYTEAADIAKLAGADPDGTGSAANSGSDAVIPETGDGGHAGAWAALLAASAAMAGIALRGMRRRLASEG